MSDIGKGDDVDVWNDPQKNDYDFFVVQDFLHVYFFQTDDGRKSSSFNQNMEIENGIIALYVFIYREERNHSSYGS